MREYKFRGASVTDIDKWKYGLYFYDGCERILDEYANQVFPESVGQYIGFKDSKGKEIYEGDIVVFDNLYADVNDYLNEYVIQYSEKSACYVYVELVDGFKLGDEVEIVGENFDTTSIEVVDNLFSRKQKGAKRKKLDINSQLDNLIDEINNIKDILEDYEE